MSQIQIFQTFLRGLILNFLGLKQIKASLMASKKRPKRKYFISENTFCLKKVLYNKIHFYSINILSIIFNTFLAQSSLLKKTYFVHVLQ